ncbi:MAG: S1/P1 nuclease [Fimbriimonadales bacterium]
MNRSLRFLAALGAFAVVASGFAWDATGHMVIAAIAEGRLNKKAWDECDRLLKIGGTPNTKGFVASSCWADDTKSPATAPWHYIDIAFRIDGRPVQTKPADENVVWAINHFSDILKDKSKPDAERADALRYLIHFVADVHQPLHAATMESDEHPAGDRGGNEFPIKAGDFFTNLKNPPTNLHSLWDMGCGLFLPDAETRPLAPDAEGRLRITGQNLTIQYSTAKFGDQLKDLNPADWAEESNTTAKVFAYKVRTGGELDLQYMTIGKTIAGQRATLAGYRLATLLNQLVGSGKS